MRSIREKLGWSQEQLAIAAGMNQNAISRLESFSYGKATLTTLKRLAAALDVALIVRFAPFSELTDWITGTPRVLSGLSTAALAVASFAEEEANGTFDNLQQSASTTPDDHFEDLITSYISAMQTSSTIRTSTVMYQIIDVQLQDFERAICDDSSVNLVTLQQAMVGQIQQQDTTYYHGQ